MTLLLRCKECRPEYNVIDDEEMERVDESTLTYFGFGGRYELRFDELDLSEGWKAESATDLARKLVAVVEVLEEGKDKIPDEDEDDVFIMPPHSDVHIYFDYLPGDLVEIAADYHEETARVEFEAFREATWRFAKEIYLLCCQIRPVFAKNRKVETWYPTEKSAQRFFAELRREGLIPERER